MAQNSFLDTKGNYVEWDKDDDGVVRIKCSSCGEIQEVKDKQAAAAEASPTTFNCISCWRKGKDQDRQEVQLSTQDSIARAQSMNLAVATVVPKSGNGLDDKLKKQILEWRDWFYFELTK